MVLLCLMPAVPCALLCSTPPLNRSHFRPGCLQVDTVERDTRVPLYQGTPDDIHLAVVAAGSSHSASISRRCVGVRAACAGGVC